jgi:hypothetical protein
VGTVFDRCLQVVQGQVGSNVALRYITGFITGLVPLRWHIIPAGCFACMLQVERYNGKGTGCKTRLVQLLLPLLLLPPLLLLLLPGTGWCLQQHWP